MIRGLLFTTVFALGALGCGERETYEPPEGEGPWVLVDLYHTRIQNPEDYKLEKGNYNYQGTYGYSRVFDHLENNGYKWRSIRDMELSAPRLEGFDVLFINLVHEERPDFTDDEIEVIKQFVKDGGGLFVISDHTNVYYHAQRINRFLEPMGIEVTYHSALEPGAQSLSGLGWIAIEDFADHPTNAGVELMGFQTGGPMKSIAANAVGTGFTSEMAYGDFWDESTGAGFYGNWTYDGDPTLEPKGRFPVTMVSEYGKGRVVVAGDQNLYGDAFVHFGDNWRHFHNSIEWLAQEENTPGERLGEIKPAGFNVGVDAKFTSRSIANGAADSYYTFYVNFNRDADVTGRAITRLDNKDDALVLPTASRDYTQEDMEAVVEYLKAGKKVVITTELDDLGNTRYRPTIELIQQLAPDFTVKAGEQTFDFNQDAGALSTQIRMATLPETKGTKSMTSSRLDVAGMEVGSWRAVGSGDDATREAYLYELTTDWGEPLLAAEGGIDIARSKRMGDGELIIVIQDGFWRNRTTGVSESAQPPAGGQEAIDLQFALLDYLKKPLEACTQRCGALPEPDISNGPGGDGPRVLVDLYHTRKQNPEDYRLVKGLYRYQGTHGWARAFDHLENNGYTWRSVREEPLSEQLLANYDVLFINLVHDERPDFSADEVTAIKEFVENGGGLFVVGDHSNVYYHAQRINRFLKPMGIEVTYHTAIDYGEHQVAGLAWIAIDDIINHPTTEGVDMLSFQTGGLMRKSTEDGTVIARLSDQGFGDFWDESTGVGFYGNWSHDGDDDIEPRGASPVGMAAEYGQGRVVVIGDQNMMGDVWLHMAGNFKHWLNTMEWLSQTEGSGMPLRNTRPFGTNIGVDMHHTRFSPGNASLDNYYTFFVNFNRDQGVTGRGITEFDNSDDVLILPTAKRDFDQPTLERINAYLEAGKRVVVMCDIDTVALSTQTHPTIDLIRYLAPSFEISSATTTVSFEGKTTAAIVEELKAANITRKEGLLELESEVFDVDGITVGSYNNLNDDATAHVVEVTSGWGTSLVKTTDGVDIARRKKVGAGELVVFIQDGFWRVRTMGKTEIAPPPTTGAASVDFQYRFIDYLKSPLD